MADRFSPTRARTKEPSLDLSSSSGRGKKVWLVTAPPATTPLPELEKFLADMRKHPDPQLRAHYVRKAMRLIERHRRLNARV